MGGSLKPLVSPAKTWRSTTRYPPRSVEVDVNAGFLSGGTRWHSCTSTARHGTVTAKKYRRCCTRALLYTSKRSPSKNGWSFPHTSSQRQGHLHSKKTGAEDHESADNLRPAFLLCPHSARCGVSSGSNELWRSTVLAPRLRLLNPAIGKPGHRVQSRTALSGPACATTRTNARRPTQHGAELLELAILHHGERKVSRSNELTNLQLESLQLFCIHGP